jgi:NCAIR mutase (PurE)-related protein
MLNSCAPGITVVNIDNGFGAAYSVHRIALTSSASDFTPRSRSAQA